jgi:hypothetical protein
MKVGHSDFNIPEFAPKEDENEEIFEEEFRKPLDQRLESTH